MKNIHILPTDNYSPLVYSTNKYGGLFLSKYYSPMKNMGDSYQNIYITSDEEIKDCWVLNIHTNQVYFVKGYYGIQPNIKKIILTTDIIISPDLQKMDDEFLEWFVKNPSCEEVEVELFPKFSNKLYGMILPKEEPKQDYSGVHLRHCYQGEYEDGCKYGEDDCPAKPLQEPKQETLEEAAKKYATNQGMMAYVFPEKEKSFIDGAKWQQERMYSEEEVKHIVSEALQSSLVTVDLNQWFEQFKKK